MITYKTFISELRSLVDQIAQLHEAKRMHEDPAFRRWRHELQSLVRQIKDAGYVLPSPMTSASRAFGGHGEWRESVAFEFFQRDMDDTANELRTILDAYQRDGEPPLKAAGSMRPALVAPEKVTIPWLLHNVPATLWGWAAASFVAALAAAFWLGYAASKNEFFSKLIELSAQ